MRGQIQILNIFQTQMLCIYQQWQNKIPILLEADLRLPEYALSDVFLSYLQDCQYNQYNNHLYILNYKHNAWALISAEGGLRHAGNRLRPAEGGLRHAEAKPMRAKPAYAPVEPELRRGEGGVDGIRTRDLLRDREMC